jgi:hypothetical protein
MEVVQYTLAKKLKKLSNTLVWKFEFEDEIYTINENLTLSPIELNGKATKLLNSVVSITKIDGVIIGGKKFVKTIPLKGQYITLKDVLCVIRDIVSQDCQLREYFMGNIELEEREQFLYMIVKCHKEDVRFNKENVVRENVQQQIQENVQQTQ